MEPIRSHAVDRHRPRRGHAGCGPPPWGTGLTDLLLDLAEACIAGPELARRLMALQDAADERELDTVQALARAEADPSDTEAMSSAMSSLVALGRISDQELTESARWSAFVMRAHALANEAVVAARRA